MEFNLQANLFIPSALTESLHADDPGHLRQLAGSDGQLPAVCRLPHTEPQGARRQRHRRHGGDLGERRLRRKVCCCSLADLLVAANAKSLQNQF